MHLPRVLRVNEARQNTVTEVRNVIEVYNQMDHVTWQLSKMTNEKRMDLIKDGRKMNKISFSDLNITCVDCERTFVFSAGEQAFFASKALSLPKRCPACRKQRKLTIVPDRDSQLYQNSRCGADNDSADGGTE